MQISFLTMHCMHRPFAKKCYRFQIITGNLLRLIKIMLECNGDTTPQILLRTLLFVVWTGLQAAFI